MKPIFTLGLGVALSLATVTADAAQLRQSVSVSGEHIRLGDLFDGVADQADRQIASAPALGRSVTFDLDALRRLAAAYHVDWQPAAGDTKIVITRATRTVGLEDMRAPVIKALSRRTVGGRLQVEFDNPSLQVVVPSSTPAVITVENLYYNPTQNHFSADVMIGAGSPAPQRVMLTGHASLMIEMPVLTRRVNPGELITRADIGWIEFNSSQLMGDLAASEADLIDHTPRRGLPVSGPVNLRDVQMPRLVTRGQLVTMVLKTKNMLITTQGKATQDGAKGEVITVVNVQSNRSVDATVIGTSQVAVSVPGAMLN